MIINDNSKANEIKPSFLEAGDERKLHKEVMSHLPTQLRRKYDITSLYE